MFIEFEPPIGGAIANFKLREMQFYFTYETQGLQMTKKVTFKVYMQNQLKSFSNYDSINE